MLMPWLVRIARTSGKPSSELRRTLTNMTDATARLDQTLDVNSENIDEIARQHAPRYREPEGIYRND